MKKHTLTLNVNKIDKRKITQRSYTDKEGTEVEVRELKLELIPLRDEKKIHETEKSTLYKVGFVTYPSTKLGDNTWSKEEIIGDVVEWRDKGQEALGRIVDESREAPEYSDSDVNLDDIPF